MDGRERSRIDESGCSHAEDGRLIGSSDLSRVFERSPGTLEWLESLEPSRVSWPSGKVVVVEARRAVFGDGEEPLERSSEGWWQIDGHAPVQLGISPEKASSMVSSVAPEIDPTREWLRFESGTSALLMHELAGHGDATRLEWPGWLEAVNEPRGFDGTTRSFDDCGTALKAVDILRERALPERRSGWRDIPLPRLYHLSVRGEHPAGLAERFIAISRIGEGRYDRPSNRALWGIERSCLVDREKIVHLPRWFLSLSAEELTARLAGASGAEVQHPPRFCSERGQRIPITHSGVSLELEPS